MSSDSRALALLDKLIELRLNGDHMLTHSLGVFNLYLTLRLSGSCYEHEHGDKHDDPRQDRQQKVGNEVGRLRLYLGEHEFNDASSASRRPTDS